jgi:hypothetical protein
MICPREPVSPVNARMSAWRLPPRIVRALYVSGAPFSLWRQASVACVRPPFSDEEFASDEEVEAEDAAERL